MQGVDLSGRLAVVTGGYSGIGTETTRALAAAGAHVVVPARRPDAAREALAGIDGVRGRRARPRRPRQRRRVRRRLPRLRALDRHPDRLRRDHGQPADAGGSGLGGPVRHQPPRPLRARQPALAGAGGGRRRARRVGLLGRAPALADPLGRPALRDRLREVGRPTGRPRPPTPCSRSQLDRSAPTPACARSRCTRAGSSRRSSATSRARRWSATAGSTRTATRSRASSSSRPRRAPRPRSGARPPRSSTGSAASTARTATSPSWCPADSDRMGGVRPYAADPDEAARLWELSAELTGVDAFAASR